MKANKELPLILFDRYLNLIHLAQYDNCNRKYLCSLLALLNKLCNTTPCIKVVEGEVAVSPCTIIKAIPVTITLGCDCHRCACEHVICGCDLWD